jgi:hypothetical protein
MRVTCDLGTWARAWRGVVKSDASKQSRRRRSVGTSGASKQSWRQPRGQLNHLHLTKVYIASIQPDCISVEIDLGSVQLCALALFFLFILFIRSKSRRCHTEQICVLVCPAARQALLL